MASKESNDELNPELATTAAPSVAAPRPRSAKDYLALTIATCGVGYFPIAPGTLGSLVGVLLFVAIRSTVLGFVFPWRFRSSSSSDGLASVYYAVVAIEMVIALVITLVGIWAADRAEKLSGKKDPGKVVIDEVAGQYIALLATPFPPAHSPTVIIVLAFILFRFFDIVKPYPARRMESLAGGLGIMADDVVAGIYAAIVVGVIAVVIG